jgi:hypothetical protein
LTQQLAIGSIYFLDRASNRYQACHDPLHINRLLAES